MTLLQNVSKELARLSKDFFRFRDRVATSHRVLNNIFFVTFRRLARIRTAIFLVITALAIRPVINFFQRIIEDSTTASNAMAKLDEKWLIFRRTVATAFLPIFLKLKDEFHKFQLDLILFATKHPTFFSGVIFAAGVFLEVIQAIGKSFVVMAENFKDTLLLIREGLYSLFTVGLGELSLRISEALVPEKEIDRRLIDMRERFKLFWLSVQQIFGFGAGKAAAGIGVGPGGRRTPWVQQGGGLSTLFQQMLRSFTGFDPLDAEYQRRFNTMLGKFSDDLFYKLVEALDKEFAEKRQLRDLMENFVRADISSGFRQAINTLDRDKDFVAGAKDLFSEAGPLRRVFRFAPHGDVIADWVQKMTESLGRTLQAWGQGSVGILKDLTEKGPLKEVRDFWTGEALTKRPGELADTVKKTLGDPEVVSAFTELAERVKNAKNAYELTGKELAFAFTLGLKEGLEKDFKTLYQAVFDMAQQIRQSMESAVSDTLVLAMRGQLSKVRDVFVSFLESIQKALADFVAQRLVQETVVRALNWAINAILGQVGPKTKAPAPPAAQHGGLVTRRTLMTVGEAGPEAIIPLNRSAPGLRGNSGLGTTVNVTFAPQVIDGPSFGAWLIREKQTIKRLLISAATGEDVSIRKAFRIAGR